MENKTTWFAEFNEYGDTISASTEEKARIAAERLKEENFEVTKVYEL